MFPAATDARVETSIVRRPHAFADLAGDRVASARGERGDESDVRSVVRIRERRKQCGYRGDSGVRDRVAGAPTSTTCLGDSKQRFLAQTQARTHDRQCEGREKHSPAAPSHR